VEPLLCRWEGKEKRRESENPLKCALKYRTGACGCRRQTKPIDDALVDIHRRKPKTTSRQCSHPVRMYGPYINVTFTYLHKREINVFLLRSSIFPGLRHVRHMHSAAYYRQRFLFNVYKRFFVKVCHPFTF